MATNAVHLTRVSRNLKKLEKPRPLNISAQNRHSFNEARLGTVEEIMALSDSVALNLANGNYDKHLKSNIKTLHSILKLYGSKMETIYKDQLDRSFVTFRNGCRDDSLDQVSRILLLELIELRAMQWSTPDSTLYYKYKTSHDMEMFTTPVESNYSQSLFSQISPVPLTPVTPQPLILSPGELVKSSGKYQAPTRVVGKNYCKDEVVIRNSDSGKVMGIKGRRVHMIEELSETVISFQRVSPGAKERLVQITGPTEEKINYAKQLMEDTIRRNASPVRGEGDPDRPDSSSSLNTDSDDSLLPHNSVGGRTTLLHSFSTNDASLGEYKYTVTVGDDNIKITGTNLDLVRTAKLVLDEYFSPDTNDQYEQFAFEEGQEMFQHIDPHPFLTTQDSEESEETFKAQGQSSKEIAAFKDTNESEKTNESLSKLLKKVSTEGVLFYTVEEIIHFADSPLSRQTPPNWATLSRDFFPVIFRKKPIFWIDAATCLNRRPKEVDWVNAKIAVSPPPQPANANPE